MKTNPNDLAFPFTPDADSYHVIETGMTKREYFAGQAMAGILSNNFMMETLLKASVARKSREPQDLAAEMAVESADKLIEMLNDASFKEAVS